MSTFNAGAIEATLTLDRSPFTTGLREARAQAKRFTANPIKARIQLENLEAIKDELDDLTEDRKVEIEANLNSALATARLRVLTRPRTVPIFARINAASLAFATARLKNLGNIVLRLSGTRLVYDRLSDLKDAFADIDKLAMRWGNWSLLVGNFVNVLGAGILNLNSLLGSLGQLGGYMIPLVGIMGSIGAASAAMIIAFTGWETPTREMQQWKDAVDELAPAWERMADLVRDTFWAGLDRELRALSEAVLPSVQTGLVNIADQLHEIAHASFQAFARVDPTIYDAMFARVTSAAEILRGAVDPAVNALIVLGGVGTEQLDKIAEYLVQSAERFNNFITSASEDGRLQTWIDNASEAFHDLGQIIVNTVGIFGAINDAVQAAGGSTLDTFAARLANIRDIVEAPAFQTGLSTIFEGMNLGAGALFDALGPIGDMLGYLAPQLSQVLVTIGETVGTFLTNFANALAQPAFGDALLAFFDGLAAVLGSLGPVMPSLVEGISNAAIVFGNLLGAVGPALADALAIAAELITALSPALILVTDALAPILVGGLDLLLGLIEDLSGPLRENPGLVIAAAAAWGILNAAMAAHALSLQVAAAGGLAKYLASMNVVKVATAAWAAVQWVLNAAMTANPIGIIIVAVGLLIAGIVLIATKTTWFQDIWNTVWGGIKAAASAVGEWFSGTFVNWITSAIGFVTGYFTWQINMWRFIFTAFWIMIQVVWYAITGIFTLAVNTIKNSVSSGFNAVKDKATSIMTGMRDSISNAIRNISSAFTGLKNNITGVFSNAGTWLQDIGTRLIGGLITGIRNAFGNVREVLSNLTGKIAEWKGPPARDRRLLRGPANMIMGGFVDEIERHLPEIRAAMGRVTNAISVSGNIDLATLNPNFARPGAAGSATSPTPSVVFQPGSINVTTPNGMNEQQVGSHIASRLGGLLSSGATPTLAPVGG